MLVLRLEAWVYIRWLQAVSEGKASFNADILHYGDGRGREGRGGEGREARRTFVVFQRLVKRFSNGSVAPLDAI